MKKISHADLAKRCMTSADMMAKQTNRAFLRFWAKPDAIPLCYMLFAYYTDNAMVVENIGDADVIVEIYEQDEAPHYLGTKDDVVYLALFKPDDGLMPWLVLPWVTS